MDILATRPRGLPSARFATRPLKIKSVDLILKRRRSGVNELPCQGAEANDTELATTRIRLQDDMITGINLVINGKTFIER